MIGATVLLTTALFWFAFAPQQLYGPVTYISIVGVSMEPDLQQGDLTVLRARDEYRIGDAVAYHNAAVGKVVLHRVIDVTANGFVLRGDNNAWTDSYEPTADEVIGRLWITLPGWGARLRWITDPQHAAIVSAVLVAITMGGGSAGLAARRHRRKPVTGSQTPAGDPAFGSLLGPNGQALLGSTVLLAAGLAALAIVGYRSPTTTVAPQSVPYEQHTAFSYGSSASASGVYDGAEARTGQPVFTSVSTLVDIDFQYDFATEAVANIGGVIALDVEVSDIRGWSRTFDLSPPASFSGPTAGVRGQLDLAAVQALIDELESATGLRRDSYAVTASAAIEVSGTVAGASISDQFRIPLEFQMDSIQLYFSPTSGTVEEGISNALTATRSARVDVMTTQPATYSVLGRSYRVTAVRTAALVGSMLATLAAAAIAALMVLAHRGSEPARIQARYGPLLVDGSADAASGTRVVELGTIDDLVRIAEREQRLIVHAVVGPVHNYEVRDGETLYRYRTTTGTSFSTRHPAGEPGDKPASESPPAAPAVPAADAPVADAPRRDRRVAHQDRRASGEGDRRVSGTADRRGGAGDEHAPA